jgi:8-oxo-dGTP diphosphatase
MKVFAETDRLVLRSLEQHELPRLTALLGEWDVVRWLSVVPFPFTLQDATELFADIKLMDDQHVPEFFVVALKVDNLLIGGIGLHEPRNAGVHQNELEIGFWLTKSLWGYGYIEEAVRAAVALGFKNSSVVALCANTNPDNYASQNVLQKIGMQCQGLEPLDYKVLRGPDQILKWRLTRSAYEERNVS